MHVLHVLTWECRHEVFRREILSNERKRSCYISEEAYLVHISKAELQHLVGQYAAGVSKPKQGVICEDDLH